MKNVLETFMVFAPTRKSALKILSITAENSLNIPHDILDGNTVYEETAVKRDLSSILKVTPQLKNAPMFSEYKKMLPISNDAFLYKSVYGKTGGMLNMFHPVINESMDKTLKELFAANNGKEKAIEIWRDIKSELWSGLTPRLVWAGGGITETKLLKDFNNFLDQQLGDKEFASEGEALYQSLVLLRSWQYTKNHGFNNKRPIDLILEERQTVYERKIRFLKENNIKCDF